MNPENYPEFPILIVDDEEHFLNSMKITLKSNGITNIECCLDSRTVMPRLREKKYSLILLDILMPYIRGDELLVQIVEYYPEIPVVMITAAADSILIIECMRKGAVDYLVKPVEIFYLTEKIQSILAKPLKADRVNR